MSDEEALKKAVNRASEKMWSYIGAAHNDDEEGLLLLLDDDEDVEASLLIMASYIAGFLEGQEIDVNQYILNKKMEAILDDGSN